MDKYAVSLTVEETFQKTFVTKAESYEQAEDLVTQMYINGDINLDFNDCIDQNFYTSQDDYEDIYEEV